MAHRGAERDLFNWHLPFYAAAGSLLMFVPVTIYGKGFGELLYIFVAAPIISFILLIVALFFTGKRARAVSVLRMIEVYAALSWSLFKNAQESPWATRWLLWSREYKSKVVAQSGTAIGELRHIDWDGWGGIRAGDTSAYLVFDPNDALRAAAKSRLPGKHAGIPCPVYRVRRFESHSALLPSIPTTTGTNVVRAPCGVVRAIGRQPSRRRR